MNIELLDRQELTNFVKWTTANLRDDKVLPTTFSVTRIVEVWDGRTQEIEVELNQDEVFDLHVELGFVKRADNETVVID